MSVLALLASLGCDPVAPDLAPRGAPDAVAQERAPDIAAPYDLALDDGPRRAPVDAPTGDDVATPDDSVVDAPLDAAPDVAATDVALDVATDVAPDAAPDVVPDAAPDASPPCGALTSCGPACVDTRADDAHCGACGNACGADARCADGACRCAEGRGDCDGLRANGCEAGLRDDRYHCGACGRACPPDLRCAEGGCHPLVLSPEPRCLDLGRPPEGTFGTTVFGPPGARVVKYCRKLCPRCPMPAFRAETASIAIQASGVGVGAILALVDLSRDCNDLRLGRYECWVETEGDAGARLESPHTFTVAYNSLCPLAATCEAAAGFCPTGTDPDHTCPR